MLMIVGVFGFLALGFVWIYNSLVWRKNAVAQSSGAIEACLKKRFDLIPNLVDAVGHYMKHERGLIEEVTRLRTATPNSELSPEKMKQEDLLGRALGRLVATAEAYPDLKSNQNFLNLQASLSEVEEQISAARRAYNSAVAHYNNGLEMIPHTFVARLMNLQREAMYEAPAEQRENVNVGDLFKRRAG